MDTVELAMAVITGQVSMEALIGGPPVKMTIVMARGVVSILVVDTLSAVAVPQDLEHLLAVVLMITGALTIAIQYLMNMVGIRHANINVSSCLTVIHLLNFHF